MTAQEELAADNARKASAHFFLRVGSARGPQCGDGYSEPLFPLALIMEAEGLLAADFTYLKRCDDAIRRAAAELAA